MPDTQVRKAAQELPPGLSELRRVAIVPALNEEHTVPRVIDELRAFDAGLDIVVIDDGSTDRTADVAAKGARTCFGFRSTWDRRRRADGLRRNERHYDIAVRRRDGQHDPAQLGRILRRPDGRVDIVVGSRSPRTRGLPLVAVAAGGDPISPLSRASSASVTDTTT